MAAEVPANSQMLLEADTLIYDNDNDIVTAAGSVQIDYGGNQLVAQRVVYNRKTGRLVASGDVEIVDSNGTKIYSDEIDITDDFANGFVNALRVETVDKTYFAAESAERSGGTTDDLQQRRLHRLRTVRGKAGQGADLAHQGAEDHLERQGQDGPLRALALRVLRHADRLLPGLRDAGPDRQAQDRLPDSRASTTRATSASASSFPSISRCRRPTT